MIDPRTYVRPLPVANVDALAAAAGSRGRSTRPKTPGELVGAFLEQTGRRELTPAQRRRVRKAMNRSMRGLR